MSSIQQLEREGVIEPNGVDVLDEVARWYRRFIVFANDKAPQALALWVAHTHAVESAASTPYMCVSAPENESGKSRVLEVSRPIVARAWYVAEPSEAVLFRKVDRDRPTLLLDEYDAIFNKDREREGLRAILNMGYRRGAEVPRCHGPSLELRDFSVFCPKMLAGVGRLPKSIESRKIPVELKRKRRDEYVERFREADPELIAEGDALRNRLAAWAGANLERLAEARPALLEELTDRQQDIWEPLFAIADLVEGHWPETARKAASNLHSTTEAVTSHGETLLAHLRDAFDGQAHMATADLLRLLVDRDDGPWAVWWARDVENGNFRGPGSRLRRLLEPHGIKPKTVRIGDETAKGYERSAFEDAWERYLPSPSLDVTKVTEVTPQVGATRTVTSVTSVTSPKGETGEGSDLLDRFNMDGDLAPCSVCGKDCKPRRRADGVVLHPACEPQEDKRAET